MKRSNKVLYEQIMRNVSREVKRVLNENVNNIDISNYEYDDDLSLEDNVIMFLFNEAGHDQLDAYNGGIDVDGEWIHVDGIDISDGEPHACIWGGNWWDSTETDTMWDLAVNCLEEIFGYRYCEAVKKVFMEKYAK